MKKLRIGSYSPDLAPLDYYFCGNQDLLSNCGRYKCLDSLGSVLLETLMEIYRVESWTMYLSSLSSLQISNKPTGVHIFADDTATLILSPFH